MIHMNNIPDILGCMGDFKMFCSDVVLIFHNAMIYDNNESDVFWAAERLESNFSKMAQG